MRFGDGVVYDPIRKNWRVAVMVNGQRLYRRAKTHTEAIAIKKSLVALRQKSALDRLSAGESMLDLGGLTRTQIATLLILIESWGITDPLQEAFPEDEPVEKVEER